MTTTQNEKQVKIVAGPNEMQMMVSLRRPAHGPYGIDAIKATSVHFTTDGTTPIAAFNAAINGLVREDGSGNSWNLMGYAIDYNRQFKGYYNSCTRKGHLTFV